MAHSKSIALPLAVLVLSCLGGVIPAAAQTPATRLSGDWRNSAAVVIPASKPPLPPLAVDQGAAPGGMQLERMLLLLQPSAARQQALSAALTGLQDSRSPQYHQWLTPPAFAAAFANAPADVNAIAAWLAGQGFQVAPLPAGLGWIEFSGTVAQVEETFQTQVDLIAMKGATRATLTGGISVPGVFQPLVQGLVSLDGTLSAPALTAPLAVTTPAAALAAGNSPAQAEALTPQLMGQLLHWNPLQAAGVQGAGQTIAIAARSNLLTSDVAAFRSTFGLPAGSLTVLSDGADPGLTADEPAAVLAASWAGAAAPGAQIVVAPAATTAATDGIDLSLAAIVDQHLASTVAVDYTSCEASMSTAHQAFYAALYRQAAAEGIAVVAATGDSGAAACQSAGGTAAVSSGYGVNALASTPWNTAVGSVAFGVSGSGQWTAWSPLSAASPAYASGGGNTLLYDAPSWQAALAAPAATVASSATPQALQSAYKGWLSQATGAKAASAVASAATMNSGFRLLPDLALPTAIDTSVNPGLAFCLSASAQAAGCTLVRSGGSGAAAALFAGIAALVEQKNGAQGNLNPVLYALAQTSGVYADVTQGSALLPCGAGSAGCGAAQQIGFTAATGYDLTSGLGVVDAQRLVNNWDQAEGTSTPNDTINWYNVLLASPITVTSGGSLNLDANVQSNDPTIATPPGASMTFYDTPLYTGASTIQLCTVLTPDWTSGPPAQSNQESDYECYLTYSSLANIAAGVMHAFQATFSGDANYYGPISTITDQFEAAVQANSQTTWTTQAQTISASTPLTLAATVSPAPSSVLNVPAGVHPSGDLNFVDSYYDPVAGALQTNVPVVSNVPLSNGAVSYSLPAGTLEAGTIHNLVASYSGVATFAASQSGSITVPSPLADSIVWTPSLPAVISSGTTATFQVTVSPAGGTVNSTPTGLVSFSDNGNSLGSPVQLNNGTASITVTAGQATLSGATATLATGLNHTIAATYNCNCITGTITTALLYSPATISAGILVPAAAQVQWLTAKQTITPTTALALTVQVLSNDPTIASYPLGTVTFFDNGVSLGTVSVSTSTGIASLGLPAGQLATGVVHNLTATYNGNTTTTPYFAAASTANSIAIGVPAASIITWTTGSQTVLPTSTLTLSAAVVSGNSTVSAIPTGTVTFNDLTTNLQLGTAAVGSNGTATVSINPNPLSTGITHTIQAVYGGTVNSANPLFQGSSTSPSNIVITVPAAAQVKLTTNPQTIASTASLTLTAVVSSNDASVTSVPTGNVTFTDLTTGTPLGTVGVTVSGSATYTVGSGALASGISHSLMATYNGNSSAAPYFSTASSNTVAIGVAAASTTAWATASQSVSPTSSLTLAATVASNDSTVPSIPTGTVTFTDLTTATQLGSAAVTVNGVLGTATLTVATNPLTPGMTHTVQAAYGGNTTAPNTFFAPSTTSAANIVITVPATSKVTWITQPQNIGELSTLTLAVQVSSANAGVTLIPTGTVLFTDSTTGATLGTAQVGLTGSASLPLGTGALAAGSVHQIVAAYNGSNTAPYFSSSSSSSLAITATVSSKVTWVTAAQSVLTGASVTLTATVASSDSSVTTTPTGTIAFIDTSEGGAVLGTATLQANGQASITVSAGSVPLAGAVAALQTGLTHNIEAVYTCCATGATTIFANSTSANLAIFTPANSAINWVNVAASQIVDLTQSVVLNVKVTSVDPTVTSIPTGTVAFNDLNATTPLLTTVTLTPAGTAQVTLAAGALAVGTHVIQAVYGGSTIYGPSSTTTITITVTAKINTIVKLTVNTTLVAPDGTVIFTATVIPDAQATLEAYPTGTVEFLNGTTLIGSATLSELGVSDESVATLAVSESCALPAGVYLNGLIAVYLGDTYYAGATSLPLPSLTVQDFSVAPASTNPPENVTIVKGAMGSANFIVSGLGGFSGEIQVVCSVPSQDYLTCTPSPYTLTTLPGSVTFTVATFTTGSVSTASAGRKQIWPRALGGTALALLGCFLLPFGKRTRTFLRRVAGERGGRLLVFLLLFAGVGVAGIGCTSTNLSTANTSGTSLGVATLTITATSNVNNVVVSHNAYLTVDVIAPGSTN